MSNDDFPEAQTAALRLRCIKVLTDIDEESLRIVDSVLCRLVPSAPKARAKRTATVSMRPGSAAGNAKGTGA